MSSLKTVKKKIETLFNKWALQSSTGEYLMRNFSLKFDTTLAEASSAYASF